jgi:hypothetical protein
LLRNLLFRASSYSLKAPWRLLDPVAGADLNRLAPDAEEIIARSTGESRFRVGSVASADLGVHIGIATKAVEFGIGQRLVLGEHSHGISGRPRQSLYDIPAPQLLSSPKVGVGVADDSGSEHTPIMTLKNAALLALIGTILMTALLVWALAFNVLNALRGLVPAATLFSSFIYAFGCFSVAVFFYVFHRAQS